MIKSYKVRLEPNKQQEKQMFFQAGCARHIYNWTLAFQKERYEKGEKFISAMGMSKYLTAYKKENEWLRDCDSITLVSAYTDACTAFKNFFREVKKGNAKSYPRFKSKNKTTPAFAPNYQAIKISENQVKLPKIGTVKLSRKNYIPIVNKYSNPRVTYDGLHWYISVGVEQEDYKPELNPTVLGVDLGVKDLAICSDGTVYKNINKTDEIKKLEKRLKRLQRKVSRKYDMNKDGKVYHKTNNIIKLEKQILKLQHRIRDIRNNYRHTMTHQLVEKKPQKIVIEDLNVKGMMKNRHLSDAIGKQGFYEIQRQLQYKTQEYGIELVMADRWYPSSKTCSRCGNIKQDLKLKDRVYKCSKCGLEIDRDLNAAINLSNY